MTDHLQRPVDAAYLRLLVPGSEVTETKNLITIHRGGLRFVAAGVYTIIRDGGERMEFALTFRKPKTREQVAKALVALGIIQ
jgi:hypothetical protein